MKQTSRKKLILSSVAMMMVATVSLGSATYAWFTVNQQATVSAVKVKTAQNSNIQLSKDQNNWAYNVNYNFDELLLPASSTGDFTTFFTATASDAQGTLDTTTITSADNDAENEVYYYFSEPLYIKTLAEEPISVNWNLTAKADKKNTNYLRVALVEKTEGGSQKIVWSDDASSTEGLSNSTGGKTEYTTTKATSGTFTTAIDNTGNNCYQIVVWFEGQDPQCYDATAGCECSVSFTFTKNDSTP